MKRRPPRSTRTDTLFPDTTLFRSNMDTVAEGVETDDQLHYAREAGFTNGQGYLLRRPMTDDQVAKLLAEHHSGDPLQLPAHQPEAQRLSAGEAGSAQQRDAS